jgi:hypothetical protein
MATVSLFNCFVEDAVEGKHDLSSDTLKVVLTNSAPLAGDTVLSDITQIAAGNGYVTDGVTASVVNSSQTGGVYTLILSGISWTASGGDIAANRFAVLYNDTAPGKPLIAWADFGVSAVIANGNTETANGAWIGG